jgi:Ca2+-binding RTX toxin-like protein
VQSITLRRLLVGVLAVAAPLALAPGASAATVTVGDDGDGFPAAFYVAAPGELNDVLVVSTDTRITITDPGAVITASGRCMSIDAHSAVCRGSFLIADIAAGDLDDRVASSRRPGTSPEMVVDGGLGNDVLSGGRNEDVVLNGGDGDDQLYGGGGFDEVDGGDGNDLLHGGYENDELDGGGGADRIYGGALEDELDGGGGRDQLFGGRDADLLTDGDRDGAPGDAAPGPDTLVGGRGGLDESEADTLSYQQRTHAVRVHAGVDEDAGAARERDSISGIESIIGGAGDDRLVGDQRVNYLDGHGGADTLIGGGGRDELSGGRGGDRLLGGRQADVLTAGAGVDGLFCGTGNDIIISRRSRVREIVPDSCERLSITWSPDRFLQLRLHPIRTRRWWLSLRTACPFVQEFRYVGCRGTITVRESRGRHRLLALGSFSHGADGTSFAAPLALTSLGYRWRAGRLGSAPATVTLRMIAERTPRRPFKWTIRLRR